MNYNYQFVICLKLILNVASKSSPLISPSKNAL